MIPNVGQASYVFSVVAQIFISIGKSFPRVPPHVWIPTAFVHFDEVKIRDYFAIILESIFLDHVGDEAIGFVVAPAPFTHEAVVDQHLFVG